jgi:hypothetical protein
MKNSGWVLYISREPPFGRRLARPELSEVAGSLALAAHDTHEND